MGIVIERRTAKDDQTEKPILFVVWVDDNCGHFEPNWEMNSRPKPLSQALDEAADARVHHFPAVIVPEGETPRADGLFSAP